MSITTLPSYADLAQLLNTLQADLAVAECHGLLCGFVAGLWPVDEQLLASFCLSLNIDKSKQAIAQELVQRLYLITEQQFADQGFAFQLLLPDDELPLEEQAWALSQWCHSFLFAFNESVQKRGQAPLDDNALEFLQDLHVIAEMDLESLGHDEHDERDLTEVLEFVRIGVLYLHANEQNQQLKQQLPENDDE